MAFEKEIQRHGFLFLSGEVGVMPALHRHREVEVNLLVSGEMVYLFGGTRVLVPAGQIAVFWAMIPHQVVWRAERTCFHCVHLPLARFLQWQLPRELTGRLLHGEIVREQDKRRESQDRSLFEQWRSDLEEAAPDVSHVVLLELEARLRRLAWSRRAMPKRNGAARRRRTVAAGWSAWNGWRILPPPPGCTQSMRPCCFKSAAE